MSSDKLQVIDLEEQSRVNSFAHRKVSTNFDLAPQPRLSQGLVISGKKSKQYQSARDALLEDIVPSEDRKAGTSCMFRLCCLCYYSFCCCLCCEKSKAVTKQTFVKRFEKWLNLDNKLASR